MESDSIVGIVFIVFGFIYLMHRTTVKAQAEKEQSSPERELVNSDVEALKERVAALEKIVTDKDYQLKQELEQLNTK